LYALLVSLTYVTLRLQKQCNSVMLSENLQVQLKCFDLSLMVGFYDDTVDSCSSINKRKSLFQLSSYLLSMKFIH
jgi:hypothetical protein